MASQPSSAGPFEDSLSCEVLPERDRVRVRPVYAAMLAVTLSRNLPLNRRLLELEDTSEGQAEFEDIRARWDQLHTVRNMLNLSGLALAIAAALREAHA